MHASIILTSLLATLALANPVEKRALTTKIEVYTVWTTVTKHAAAATASSYGRSGGRSGGRGGGRHHRSSSAVAGPSAVPSSSDVVTPSSTLGPIPSSSGAAPIPSPEPATTSSEASMPYGEPVSSSEPSIPTLEASPTAVTPDSSNGVSAATSAPSVPAISSPPAPVTPSPPAPATPSPPAPATPSPAPPTGGSSYGDAILYQHNIHRENHTDTGPLTWSAELAATALKIANSCVYEHNTAIDKSQYPDGYGQNIGAGAPGNEVPAMITNGMYNDEAPAYEGLYGQADPDMSNFHAWGHFSQIAWRNTKQVGCATVECGTLQNTGGGVRPFFTVCNYSPPGNFGGQYTNVGTRLGKATVTV